MNPLLPPDRPLLCTSDLHLTDAADERFSLLSQLADLAARERLSLALLGDIVEVWIGDDDDAPLADAFRSLLERTARHTAVGLMLGNRDFLYGEQLARETGIRLLPDPYPFAEQLLLSHGDQYCTDDAEYQQLRTLFRSTDWQQDVLGRSLAERRQLATALRSQSAAANATKAANIMDVNTGSVSAALQGARVDKLLHGHTHRPAHHRSAGDGNAVPERFVLGAWERTAWVGIVPVGGLPALYCLPLVVDLDRWWTTVKAELAIG